MESGFGNYGFGITAYITRGDADPSAGMGVAAAVGSLYERSTGGAGSLYLKTGMTDTAWTQVVSSTFSGTVQATKFIADAGSNSAPSYTFNGDTDTGLYAEAANNVSFTASGTRFFRIRTSGTETFNAAAKVGHQSVLSNILTPPSLSAQADNYNPTNLSACSVIRQESSVAVTITGLESSVAGREITFMNTGSNNITLSNEDVSSDADNRLALEADIILAGGAGVELWYDAISSRWRAKKP